MTGKPEPRGRGFGSVRLGVSGTLGGKEKRSLADSEDPDFSENQMRFNSQKAKNLKGRDRPMAIFAGRLHERSSVQGRQLGPVFSFSEKHGH